MKKMSKIKSESLWRNPNDLKPDPEQPRKKFDQEKIAQLSQTMKTQGIINPIEIDENNVIITGEMRWRASKIARLKEIECKQIIGLSKIDRFERQTIENLHHNVLSFIEKENAVTKLWKSGNPQTGDGRYGKMEDLADTLGIGRRYILKILKAYKIRESLKKEMSDVTSLSTSTLSEIESLQEEDQKKIAKKIVEKKIEPSKVRNIVKTIKKIEKKAPEVKKRILDGEDEITDTKLKESEEIAELPQDIRKEVLKPESEITVKEAKEVAEFPKEEQRKEIVKQIKQTKKAGKKLIEQKKDIAKGKKPAPVKKIDLDMKFINAWKNTKLMDIPIKIRKGFLESYSETTRQECYKIVRSVVNYLIKEFSDEVKIIETKFI